MSTKTTINNNKDKKLIILGLISIGILFLIYSKFESQEITPDVISALNRIAVMFYVTLIISFGAIGIGLLRYQKRNAKEVTGIISVICNSTVNIRAKKIFVVTFIVYGIFFSMTSGVLVYQPEIIFSYHYGATVPSVHITPCCGQPGYMPKLVGYITEHFGIQIIPLNLVLQMTVSYLVATNTALAINAISVSKKTGGLGGIGATTGLFIACPTCVGSFLSLFVGATGAVMFTIAITELQTIFIGLTIPILLLTPLILARKITNAKNDNCEIN